MNRNTPDRVGGAQSDSPRRTTRTAASILTLVALATFFFPEFVTATPEPTLAINVSSGHSYPHSLATMGSSVYFCASTELGDKLCAFETNTETGSIIPSPDFDGEITGKLKRVGTSIYFVASERNVDDGSELWIYDQVQVRRVKDVNPGASNSNISGMTALNGSLIFSADDGAHGQEIWVSDGSTAGTELLLDINPGSDSSTPSNLTKVGGYVFFAANDGTHGQELWLTDGTTAGTFMVTDIHPGIDDSSPNNMTAVGSELYFSATDGGWNYEPWKSDGTAVGTILIADILPGSSGSSPGDFVEAGGWVYFSARDQINDIELWRTDGSGVNTTRVADVWPGINGSWPQGLREMNGYLYYLAEDATNGRELWRTEAVSGATNLVSDMTPGTESSAPQEMKVFDNHLYMTMGNDDTGVELWRTNGVAVFTFMFADIYPGEGSSFPQELTEKNGHLYFTAKDGTDTGEELWRTDGNDVEVAWEALSERGSDPTHLAIWEDELVFFAGHGDLRRFYKATDPADDGYVSPVRIDGVIEAIIGDESERAVGEDEVYFSANVNMSGRELVIYEGSYGELVDVIPGPAGSSPKDLVYSADRLFFVAKTSTTPTYGLYTYYNDQLWLAHDFGAHPPEQLTATASGVLFYARSTTSGYELWRSNGTIQGTRLVLDIYPGTADSNIDKLTSMGEHTYFVADHPDYGRELWWTDGTAAGTEIVEDLVPGPDGSDPQGLVDGYPFLYLAAVHPDTGRELYRTNGLALDPIEETLPGPDSGEPRNLAYCGGWLYFSADDGSGAGREPWISGGEQVLMLADMNPGPDSSNPDDFFDHLGSVFFNANDGTQGRELWRKNGNTLLMVSEPIAPGTASAAVGELCSYGSDLFFVAEDEIHGREIWLVTDDGAADVEISDPVRAMDHLQLAVGPNPFRGEIEMNFELPAAGPVSFAVADVSGRIIERRNLGRIEAGSHRIGWSDGGTLSSGVYFLRLETALGAVSRKLLRLE